MLEGMVQGWPGHVGALVWGLLWGSFLNVCICRIPRGMSVVRPASHCQSCGTPIKAIHNVPVLSWVFLRGQCHHCGAGISVRYPLIELLTALISIAIFHRVLSVASPGEPAVALLSSYLAAFAFAAALMVVAFIDMDYLIIPNGITYPAMALGLLYALLPGGVTFWQSLLGLAAGGGGLLVFTFLYSKIRGISGMGYGDVKLLGMIGAFLGLVGLPFVVLAAALQGVLFVGVVAILRRLGVQNLPLYDPAILDEDEYEYEYEDEGNGKGELAGGGAGVGADTGMVAGDVAQTAAESISSDSEGCSPSASAPLVMKKVEPIEGGAEPLPVMRLAMPFGPFLALGAIEYLLVGEEVVALYVGLIENIVYKILGLA